MTRIVCISDTHGLHRKVQLPPGDVLVHAGDITRRGTLRELADFARWLGEQDYEKIVVIAGNHDRCFERSPEQSRRLIERVAVYLEDESFIYRDLRFYGTPWQPRFFNWAFNLPRGAPLAEKWAQIPEDTDVLVSHTPPHGMLDRTRFGQHVGCESLVDAVARVSPALHVFGHIHEGYGVRMQRGVMSINASSCTVRYEPVNPPICVTIAAGKPTLVCGG